MRVQRPVAEAPLWTPLRPALPGLELPELELPELELPELELSGL